MEESKARKSRGAQYSCSPPADWCSACSWAGTGSSQPAPPSFYTEQWCPVIRNISSVRFGQLFWPCPLQFFVHLVADRAWKNEKSLIYSKHCWAATKTSVCYHHYSHPKSITQHCTCLFQARWAIRVTTSYIFRVEGFSLIQALLYTAH